MVAERQGVELSNEDKQEIIGGISCMPPHPEVEEGLGRLRDAGIRLVALLTNSTQEVAESQVGNSGLGGYFEQILSADGAKRLKPTPAPYRMSTQSTGVGIEQIRLVAAHAWDVTGAILAGCAAAFVARPRMMLDPVSQYSDVVGADLVEVADGIIEAEAGG
jgi:2-haloacid dehalogenase